MDNSAILNVENNKSIQTGKSIFKDVFFWALLVCVELIFFRVSFYRLLGPVMACIFTYLYFVKKETVLVTTFIVLAHYELKAVLISTMSFPQLLFVFICCDIVLKSKWKATAGEIATICLALFMTVVPALLGSITFEDTFYLFMYIFAMYMQYCKNKDDKDSYARQLSLTISVVVTLICIQALVTGGVEYADMDNAAIIRRGILAAGIGDPNFSCLLICSGIISALNCKGIYWWVRIIMVVIMISAMVITVSTTGLLGLVLIAIMYSLINQKFSNKVRNIIIVALIVVCAVQIYMSLPKEKRIEGIETYVVRMEDKYTALNQHDLAVATTNRTNLSGRYMKYINEGQSFVKTLFGGNSVVPEVFTSNAMAHVTYIDFLLQYGYIGTLLLMLVVLYRLRKLFLLPTTLQYRGYAISLKVLYLFFALSISIFKESAYAMLFFALFIL